MEIIMEILCIGVSCVDVILQQVVNGGEGHTSFAERIDFQVGGDAANEAITLSALGHEVGLITQMGEDWQGKLIREYCLEKGVNMEASFTGKSSTAVSVITVREDGQRTIVGCKGSAAENLCLEPAVLDYIRPGVKAVMIGSLFCSRYLDGPALARILRRAKEVGAVTAADFLTDRKEWTLDTLKEAFLYLDYAMPSIEEAAYYTGEKEPEKIAEVFRSYGISNTIIKLGKDGAYGCFDGDEYRCPAFQCRVVDTTGAGDNFAAGFLSALIRGLSPAECLRFASAAAALSVQEPGATSGVKNRQQVEKFMQK